MKFSSVIVFALLSTVATTLAAPLDKRAASAAVQAQNAADANALNQKFATLTPNSPCTNGETACVNGDVAKCANNKFVTTPCAPGTTCAALPLVNSRGTSVTCDTPADRDARIKAAEGNSGSTGTPPPSSSASNSSAANTPSANGSASNSSAANTSSANGSASNSCTGGNPASNSANTSSASGASNSSMSGASNSTGSGSSASTSSSGGDISSIRKQNAADAIAQQNSFNSLNANSPCTSGQNACVDGGFAQCVGGKFAVTQCAAGEKCFALPLVNKSGTSVSCDTQQDRDARIAAAQQGQS